MNRLLKYLLTGTSATLAVLVPWIGTSQLAVHSLGKDSPALIPISLIGLIIGCYFAVNILSKQEKADNKNDGSRPILKRRIEDNSSAP